jgi:4,5-dihydroxyphthalate decarboxylase
VISLTCAISEYDHVRDLESGRVKPEGIALSLINLPVEEIFFRSIRFGEFDLSEMSMGRYAALLSAGTCPFVAIPVFPSRAFRHSAIYVRSDSKIRQPKDLSGGRIGIPEWAQTAGIYVRGMLEAEYGLSIRDVEWVQGGLYQTGREEEVVVQLPNGVRLRRAEDRTLSDMLDSGDLDAVMSAHPPAGFARNDGSIRTLFENCGEVESRYFEKTGIFPIMHTIVIKRDVFERDRWIAMNLLKAFILAKDRSLTRAREMTASRFPFPQSAEFVRSTVATFGNDFWPYGIERNRTTLEAFLNYAFLQGVTSRPLRIEELFPAEVLVSFKI